MNRSYREISTEQYTYHLPQEKIAFKPLEERDASKLLVYRNGNIEAHTFRNIADLLEAPSLMVFNNTRVVQARLVFQKESGALIEIFCLEPSGSIRDIQLALQQQRSATWFCLVGNAKKWKQGTLSLDMGNGLTLKATKGEKHQDGFLIQFNWDTDHGFAEILDRAGKTPLPPYIGRKAEDDDKIRYQTIYARNDGSVAAPTAGLHFTPGLMSQLNQKGVAHTYVTLHVGAGTFKPVSSATIGGHQMHREQIIVDKDTLGALLKHCSGTIISIGTTSLRTLESLYWLGVKLMHGYDIPPDGFRISQWEPYENDYQHLPRAGEALEKIVTFMEENRQHTIAGETSLIIVPGYRIRIANVLVTNFHQPGSTLLLLVAAFCGDDWERIYQYALGNEFRFLSYGDSCLLFGKRD